MKKTVLTMALALSGALVATVANGSDDYKSWPGHKDHTSKSSRESSRLPLRAKYSKKVMKTQVHNGVVQASKSLGLPLKRKASRGEVQAQEGWDIPLKRKIHQAGAVKNNFHIPLRRAKHSRTDVGKDLSED